MSGIIGGVFLLTMCMTLYDALADWWMNRKRRRLARN